MRCHAKRLGLLWALALAPAAGALATEPEAPSPVPLDRLLTIPSEVPVEGRIERRGGSTRPQWQGRFERAHAELEAAEKAVLKSREEIGEIAADGSWKMSAPGLGAAAAANPDTPMDYRLTQELRRNREELARAERQLQELEVEANLAGVPDAWRRPDDAGAGGRAAAGAESAPE